MRKIQVWIALTDAAACQKTGMIKVQIHDLKAFASNFQYPMGFVACKHKYIAGFNGQYACAGAISARAGDDCCNFKVTVAVILPHTGGGIYKGAPHFQKTAALFVDDLSNCLYHGILSAR
jgi:hypothetical protein